MNPLKNEIVKTFINEKRHLPDLRIIAETFEEFGVTNRTIRILNEELKPEKGILMRMIYRYQESPEIDPTGPEIQYDPNNRPQINPRNAINTIKHLYNKTGVMMDTYELILKLGEKAYGLSQPEIIRVLCSHIGLNLKAEQILHYFQTEPLTEEVIKEVQQTCNITEEQLVDIIIQTFSIEGYLINIDSILKYTSLTAADLIKKAEALKAWGNTTLSLILQQKDLPQNPDALEHFIRVLVFMGIPMDTIYTKYSDRCTLKAIYSILKTETTKTNEKEILIELYNRTLPDPSDMMAFIFENFDFEKNEIKEFFKNKLELPQALIDEIIRYADDDYDPEDPDDQQPNNIFDSFEPITRD